MSRLTMSHVDQKIIHFNLVNWLTILKKLSLGSISLDLQVTSFLTILNKSFDNQLLTFVRNHVNLRMNIFSIFAIRPQNHRNLLGNINPNRMMNFELFLKLSRLGEFLTRHKNVTHEISVNPADPFHSQSRSDPLDVLFIWIS